MSKKKRFKSRSRQGNHGSKIHSYAFRYMMDTEWLSAPKRRIHLFRLQPVDPKKNLKGVAKKFQKRSEYVDFAPFRERICCELFTNEDDWSEMTDRDATSAIKFSEYPPEERLKIIQGYADTILLLLRLRGKSWFTVPCEITGSTFKNLRSAGEKTVTSRFRYLQAIIHPTILPGNINPWSDEDFEWIESHIEPTIRMNTSSDIRIYHDIMSSLNFCNPSVQLVQIWAGIESIVKSKSSNTRHSIRSRCAMLLGDTSEEQKNLYDRVGKLYDFRCEIVHGKKSFILEEYLSGMLDEISENNQSKPDKVSKWSKLRQSYEILCDLLVKMIQDEEIPTIEKLEKMQDEFEKLD